MKRVLFPICLVLALTLAAWGQSRVQNDTDVTPTVRHTSTVRSEEPMTTRGFTTTRPVTTQRYISRAPFRQPTSGTTPSVRTNANANVRYGNTVNARVRSNVAVNRDQNIGTPPRRNYSAAGRTNMAINRNRNVAVTNNWRGNQFRGSQYAAFRNYQRQWHDRDWWRDHFRRVIFVSGFGWWCWDAGYWYPCWGYDPYAFYPYDGPIYGYADLTPDQIVAEVQAQLQADGYYDGPIDGILGPDTREAIATFQADNGLAITSTVDEPTVATLGIT